MHTVKNLNFFLIYIIPLIKLNIKNKIKLIPKNSIPFFITFPLSIGTVPTTFFVCPFIANVYIFSLNFIFNIHTGNNAYSTSPLLIFTSLLSTVTELYPLIVDFYSSTIVFSILFFALSYTSSLFKSYFSAKKPDKYDLLNGLNSL